MQQKNADFHERRSGAMLLPRAGRTRTYRLQPYHTDVCDILALFAIDLPLNGGESLLSPSSAVYNEIAATRPDVIKTLSEPIWIYDKYALVLLCTILAGHAY